MGTIHQHFRPEEAGFIDQVTSWIEQVEQQYAPKLTDFLDPRQALILQTVIGTKGEVLVQFHGGGVGAERKRALLYPTYYEPSEEDFHLSVFKVKYPAKFVTIEHRHMLGALMNVGLKREKFGDLLHEDGAWYCVIAKEVSDYVRLQLHAVGKSNVVVEECLISAIPEQVEEWQDKSVTVSSLRIDALLATIYPISRQKAADFIQAGMVKVNWQVVEQTSFTCEAGDVLSLRKKGRAKIISIEGQTKKEKTRVVVGIKK